MADPVPFRRNDSGQPPATAPDAAGNEESRPTEDLRRYTNEEVSEIIRLALRNAEGEASDTVNHEEMLAIGKDFGLTPEDIEGAFVEVGETQNADRIVRQALAIFQIHAALYVPVNVIVFIVYVLTGPQGWWFLYPLLIWGTLLAVHGITVKFTPALLTLAVKRIEGISKEFADANAVMRNDPRRLDFTIPELYGSLAEAKGLAHIEDSDLLLEYEVKDTIFGAIKSKAREIRVPFKDITTVQLDRGLWQTKLRIRGRKLQCFSGVPGSSGGDAVLVIARQSRQNAEQFSRELAKRVAKER